MGTYVIIFKIAAGNYAKSAVHSKQQEVNASPGRCSAAPTIFKRIICMIATSHCWEMRCSK